VRSPLPEKQDEFAPAHRIRRPLSTDRVGDTAEFTTHLTRLCELDHIGLNVGCRYFWLKRSIEGQKWPNMSRSLGSGRSTETNDQEVP
jgi:hypothetical protein